MAYRDYSEGIVDPNRDVELAYAEPAPGATTSEPDVAAEIDRLYRQYYFRPPTPQELSAHVMGLRRGAGTLAGIEAELQRDAARLGLKPPTADTPATRGAAPSGVDPDKWASGHTSPKYAFMEVSQKYDQKTAGGRQQTLAELQQRYPQWFTGWTISGDKLRFSGDPNTLDPKWDGFNEFDAWVGSKEGKWQPAWQPTQRGGTAYVEPTAGVTPAPSAPVSSATTPINTPDALPSQAVSSVDWFAQNMPSAEPYTLPDVPAYLQGAGGAAVSPDASQTGSTPGIAPYTTPAVPDALATPYAAPTFVAPTYEDLAADPGYRARLNTGVLARDRMAASKGSLLSGGYGKAIERYAQEFAGNEFKDLYGRRFGEFQTQAALGANARQVNQGEYQDAVQNAMSQFNARQNTYQNLVNNNANQYATRYKAYRDAIGDSFRLAELGLTATTAGRY